MTGRVKKLAPRMWLVFFTDGEGNERWWSRFLKPGFKHVCAASFFADEGRWIFIDPARGALVVECWEPADFGARLAQLIEDSSAIVRMPGSSQREAAPIGWWCVGAVKHLLGFPGRALSPFGLYGQLLANGGEIVDLAEYGWTIQTAEGSARRSESHGTSQAGTGTGGAR